MLLGLSESPISESSAPWIVPLYHPAVRLSADSNHRGECSWVEPNLVAKLLRRLPLLHPLHPWRAVREQRWILPPVGSVEHFAVAVLAEVVGVLVSDAVAACAALIEAMHATDTPLAERLFALVALDALRRASWWLIPPG